jgi:pyridoxine/pyridoxamine 5'-phosphate oxidase
MDLAHLRKEYTKTKLSKKSVDQDPIKQFNLWLKEALQADCMEPTAMTISTVSEENAPSSRIVLLKGVENRRFTFYTNYKSRKGNQLDKNPVAAIPFVQLAGGMQEARSKPQSGCRFVIVAYLQTKRLQDRFCLGRGLHVGL